MPLNASLPRPARSGAQSVLEANKKAIEKAAAAQDCAEESERTVWRGRQAPDERDRAKQVATTAKSNRYMLPLFAQVSWSKPSSSFRCARRMKNVH
ncbi:hypothetical protein ACLQ2R_36690 [Streptosporangium sp. DT93]|uniref:hypothetical protein n=1 Tax=Streptosporangium sp. DT93 TaxID=3393428 RepID=UPI003CF85040